ncbi:MAG TPA: sulfotransferase [Candidatus Binataceae bacterium]|nr:sulfotransferase [Candidatus Binataceae bacterium]
MPIKGTRQRMPEFIAVGPQRSGTTWLHEVLSPHTSLPIIKETGFFGKHYARGWNYYLAFFSDPRPDRPMGEVDPNYFADPKARERIKHDIPGCKIIVSLRDPAERAWSSYRTMRRDAWTRVGFEETVEHNAVILESTRYAHYLKAWQDDFGADKVLITFYDDLEADPQDYLDRICGFIGIPHIPIAGAAIAGERINKVERAPKSRRLAQNARNARDWLRTNRFHRTLNVLGAMGVWEYCFGRGEPFGKMDPEVAARLRMRWRPEVEALEKLIGRDLSAWKRQGSA